MHITAYLRNGPERQETIVATDERSQSLAIPPKPAGRGSAVNGGELLMLALATCYCNDLYREAERLDIALDGVEVEAAADFDGRGLAAKNVRYTARVASSAPPALLAQLLAETDAVAEIHNTVRAGVPVVLNRGSPAKGKR